MKLKLSTIIVAVVLVSILLTQGCSNTATSVDEDKVTVAVSIIPQASFVRAITGDLVNVVTLIPPGYSPANYAPSPKEMAAFSEAEVYFAIGVPTEEANILPKAKSLNPDIDVVNVHTQIARLYPEREFAPGKRDPHIWLSPKRVKEMIRIMAEELGRIDSENSELYYQNAQQYIEQLQYLDKAIQAGLGEMENKTIVVYHPAFGYLADDYGFKMLALEEDGKEATAQDLREAIDLARQEGIKVIFYQAEVDSRQSEIFAQEIGGIATQVEPLAAEYIDNLSQMVTAFRKVHK